MHFGKIKKKTQIEKKGLREQYTLMKKQKLMNIYPKIKLALC